MGQILTPESVVRIAAVFSRYDTAFEWAGQWLTERWGELLCETEAFPFEQTAYYTSTMGPHLRKKFYAFREPIAPTRIVVDKTASNAWEEEFAVAHSAEFPEPRPLNIDPGYVSLSKLVLASTKDFAHRICVGDGIYAEITLSFYHRAWTTFPWTFPDYAEPTYHPFLNCCRDHLHEWLKNERRNMERGTDEVVC